MILLAQELKERGNTDPHRLAGLSFQHGWQSQAAAPCLQCSLQFSSLLFIFTSPLWMITPLLCLLFHFNSFDFFSLLVKVSLCVLVSTHQSPRVTFGDLAQGCLLRSLPPISAAETCPCAALPAWRWAAGPGTESSPAWGCREPPETQLFSWTRSAAPGTVSIASASGKT